MFNKRKLKKEINAVAKIVIGDKTKLLFSISNGIGKNAIKSYKDALVDTLGCECIFIDEKIRLKAVID